VTALAQSPAIDVVGIGFASGQVSIYDIPIARITEQYLEHIDRVPNLHCKMRHTHHQFGPLDAHGWHCLAAIHQNIHRKQIERIVVIATNPDSLIL